MKKELRDYFSKIGKKGGKKGGINRMAGLTKAQKHELAMKGVESRRKRRPSHEI